MPMHRARVKGGRLILDEATDLPEGTEVALAEPETAGSPEPGPWGRDAPLGDDAWERFGKIPGGFLTVLALVERRAGSYLRMDPPGPGRALEGLQNFIQGYMRALDFSGVADRGAVIYQGFPQWLVSRRGWDVSRGPIWAVQGEAASDGEAWTEFWRLLWECVDSQPAAVATDGSQDSGQDTEDEPTFDDELSPEESARVASLPARDLDEIDAAILAIAHQRWQKVGFIVSQMVTRHQAASDGGPIPMRFYLRRIAALAGEGRLESKGDIRRLGYSEVRLPIATKNSSAS